jgi:small basic protein
MFSLRSEDFAKGAALAVIVAVLGAVQQALTAHGFDVASYDWGFIINVAITAFVGYLGKNFVSDEKGAVLGKVGGAQ